MVRIVIHAICRCLISLFFGTQRAKIPESRQCIVVANHNTHIDTLVLLQLFPLRGVNRVRVVAAKDYFDKGPGGIVGRLLFNLILLDRRSKNPIAAMAPIEEALRAGDSVLLFPEGTRGEPGVVRPFKGGIGKLALDFPDIAVQPVCLHGIERTLPRGGFCPVPFNVFAEPLTPVYGRDFAPLGPSQGRKALAAHLEKAILEALEGKPHSA